MTEPQLILAAALHLFRSRFFSLLIAALMLAGYSEVVHGFCRHHAAEIEEEDGPASPDSDGGHGHACDCISHQTFVNEQPTAPFEPVLRSMLSVILDRADRPLDALPVGIDYP